MGVENRVDTNGVSPQPGVQVESFRATPKETVLFVGNNHRKRINPAEEMKRARGLVAWGEQTGNIEEVTPNQWKAIFGRFYTQDSLPLEYSTLAMMWGGSITRAALFDRVKGGHASLEKAKMREEGRKLEASRSKKGVRMEMVANARANGHFSQLPPEDQAFLDSRYPVEGDQKTLKQCVEEGLCNSIDSGSILEKQAIIKLVGLELGMPISRRSRILTQLDSLLEENPNLPIREIVAMLKVSKPTAYKYMKELPRVTKRNGRIARRAKVDRALID